MPGTVDWIRVLRSGTPNDRKNAIRKVQAADPAEIDLVIPALIECGDADTAVGLEAAFSLARYLTGAAAHYRTANQDHARSAVNRLLLALGREPDADVCASAANVLSSLCCAMAEPASGRTDHGVLIESSLTPWSPRSLPRSSEIRRIVCRLSTHLSGSVRRLWPRRRPSWTPWDDPSPTVRARVFQTLSHFSSGFDRAIPVLIKDLETASDRVAPDYFKAARAMHPSVAVVPTLIQSLESDDLLVSGRHPPGRQSSPRREPLLRPSSHACGSRA